MATRRQAEHVFEVAVIGGGLTGYAAAIVLAKAGFDVCHVAAPAPVDRRTSALMKPSTDWLIENGLVEQPEAIATPLHHIRIIDATKRLIRSPETLFSAQEIGQSAFAWNFPNARLMERWQTVVDGLPGYTAFETGLKSLAKDGDTHLLSLGDGTTASATLLVGADGKRSLTRQAAGIATSERAFKQSALVADVELERPLHGTSTEFHYENGPFTLVPAGGSRANLVWIDKAAELDGVRLLDETKFAARLSEKSQFLFGQISPLPGRFVFPLSVLSVDRAGRDTTALIGEAAHAFPPIGAQGLNLGLRDVADLLASASKVSTGNSGWAGSLVDHYVQMRHSDLRRTSGFVDGLFSSLISDLLPAQALRAGGLWALKLSPVLRHKAFQTGMGQV